MGPVTAGGLQSLSLRGWVGGCAPCCPLIPPSPSPGADPAAAAWEFGEGAGGQGGGLSLPIAHWSSAPTQCQALPGPRVQPVGWGQARLEQDEA